LAPYRETTNSPEPKVNIGQTYVEAFQGMVPPRSAWLGWFGEGVIVVGGILAYFFHPAWLALSILGLSWTIEAKDMATRTSVAAIVLCLKEIADYMEQEKKELSSLARQPPS